MSSRWHAPACSLAFCVLFPRIILPLLALAFNTLPAQEKPGAKPERVRFEGQTLVLASSNAGAEGSVREFIPEGEKLASWTRLAALREYPKLDDPMAVGQNVLRQLKERYPDANSAIIRNPSTGEVIVDFLVTSPDQKFMEFNIFKYTRKPGAGLSCQQYALRAYGDPRAFLVELKSRRKALIDAMAKTGLEIVK